MAANLAVIWRVFTTGLDNNGGGFKTGASGTDYSQQDTAQYALTGIASAGTGNTILSAAAAADMVGNCATVVSGTNFTTGPGFEVVSVSVGVSITFSTNKAGASICTGVGASGVINIGGAFLTPQRGLTECAVAGMICAVKAGTYVISTALAVGAANNAFVATTLVGYTTTIGDHGRPVIQTSAAVHGIDASNSGWVIQDIEFDGNSTGTIGINGTATVITVTGCRARRFTSDGITCNQAYFLVQYCESVSNGGTGIIIGNSSSQAYGSWAHSNTTRGFYLSAGAKARRCISSNHSGGSADGFYLADYQTGVDECVAYTNGRSGIYAAVTAGSISAAGSIRNNILYGNGAYGIDIVNASATLDYPMIEANAYKNNTSGARHNFNAERLAVTLTADPFTNAAGDDYTLNNTAGGGAACRSAGVPGLPLTPNMVGTDYTDIGWAQAAVAFLFILMGQELW